MLTVDTYAVQHPSAQRHCSLWSTGIHLIGLCLLLERAASVQQTTGFLGQLLERPPSFRLLKPPVPNGTITISDVISARNPDEHARLVEQWAAKVWDAWAPHHATVRGWIEEAAADARSPTQPSP